MLLESEMLGKRMLMVGLVMVGCGMMGAAARRGRGNAGDAGWAERADEKEQGGIATIHLEAESGSGVQGRG